MNDSIYSTGSRWFQRGLGALDAVLARVLPTPDAPPIAEPRRILIANTGHLGDVILSTAVLPVLRRAYPASRIGLLIGSWSRFLLRDHPLIDAIHCFDHCRLNRTPGSWWQKLTRHDRTRRRALREIRAARYDVALDLRHYFANAIPLLWHAGIPVRIGYSAGGFGAMLTHCLRWRRDDRHVVDYFADLLRVLPGMNVGDLRPVLAGADVPPSGLPRAPFAVVHMGTGAACKEWPLAQWRDLTQRLRAMGYTIVLTGQGERERVRCAQIEAGCVNLCDRLTWSDYVATVRRAQLVVAVDSLAGHVAAAVDTPCVIVGNGINHPTHWRPLGVCRVVTHPVACAPCYRPNGCATMDCVRGVNVDDVLRAIAELTRTPRRQSA